MIIAYINKDKLHKLRLNQMVALNSLTVGLVVTDNRL